MWNDFRQRFGKAIMETIGAFVLLLTIQLSVDAPSSDKAPMVIGLALIGGGGVRGGPIYFGCPLQSRLSLAVTLRGQQTGLEMVRYWIFQLLGGTFLERGSEPLLVAPTPTLAWARTLP